MTDTNKNMITLEEASREVEMTSKRLGLLYLAFAKSIVEELGDEKGKKLILKAIKNYGKMAGEKMKKDIEDQGLEPTPENYGAGEGRGLPKFGMNEKSEEVEIDGQKRKRFYGCAMGKVWREYGEEELGKLYCYVDAAKYMYYNPDYKLIHTKAMPADGVDYCEFCVQETTEKEKEDFFSEDKDWSYIDETLQDK